jgi:hypothetical protein
VAHAFNPSTLEAEAGRFLSSGLQSEFQDNQGYTEKPCLEKPKKENKQTCLWKAENDVLSLKAPLKLRVLFLTKWRVN